MNKLGIDAPGAPCTLASRREVFASALALVGGGLLCAPVVDAQMLNPQVPPTDLTLLNYFLTLENLEATFWTQGLAKFSSADFANAAFVQNFGSVIISDVYAYLCLIRDHDAKHIRMLKSAIASLGGTPVSPNTYSFPWKTADDFAALAVSMKNTAIAAYNGALYQIQNLTLRSQMATIATVEGRHSAYLSLLSGVSPAPVSFDTASTPSTVLTTLGAFNAAH